MATIIGYIVGIMKYSALSLFAILFISCGDQKEIFGNEQNWKKSDAFFQHMDAKLELLDKLYDAAINCDHKSYNRLAAEYNKKFVDKKKDFLKESDGNCTPSKKPDNLQDPKYQIT